MLYLQICKMDDEIMNSKIFTETEHNCLKERLTGSKKDTTGIFSARVKPKLIEMFEYWFPKREQLIKLINYGRKKNGR